MNTTLDNYKLSCELLGHSMDVRAVYGIESPEDGKQVIISGSRDKTVKIWKTKNVGDKEYSETMTYQDHKNFVSCVFYLESAQWICTGSNDSNICIYQQNGYVPILTLKGHESTVCSIAAGIEPHSIISGSWDKTARIWTIDQLGGFTFVVLRGHEAAVWAVASMPNTKNFITGSADKNILYWNAKGEKLRLLKGHTDCVRGILALSDNSIISCANDAHIRHWNEDGECIQELLGHTNYIYSVAQNRALGNQVVVSSGEDSSVRMWSLATGEQLGGPLIHPTQSVWSVSCLSNGDIVTGSSDGIVRVFTKDTARMAEEIVLQSFHEAVEVRKAQMNEELGGFKKTDLPGPEGLLSNGTREGQTRMIRHSDGSVKVYSWEQNKWNLIGDVEGASGGNQITSGKTLYEGKEYDFVFSVDISDTEPPIKLPYNRGEDPWQAAQTFIHRNNLPQAYLDQVANFIIKNSSYGGVSGSAAPQPASSGYQDPFTGGSRYVPGSSNSNLGSAGNVDPFTGDSSYSTIANIQQQQQKIDADFVSGQNKHFPVSKYLTFDNYDPLKVLEKLKEFNSKIPNEELRVSEEALKGVMKLAEPTPTINTENLETLKTLLHWPVEYLFPALDITRLAVRNPKIFDKLGLWQFLNVVIIPQMNSTAPNQLMCIRSVTNMMTHPVGRTKVIERLEKIVETINGVKSGSANLQIAIATLYLNITITETLQLADAEQCRLLTEGIIELLKWSTDLEACYRSMQAIGNLTTTPFGAQTVALIMSVDVVMNKLREITSRPQTEAFGKLNVIGRELLSVF